MFYDNQTQHVTLLANKIVQFKCKGLSNNHCQTKIKITAI